jgi:hypothetical protein
MGSLDLSDSDTDALFDTPAARKDRKNAQHARANAGQGAMDQKTRAKESHYTAEEAREAALRRELESIRNVNKVIEGVVESLQKAKDNMAVCSRPDWVCMIANVVPDGLQDCPKRFYFTSDMDPNSITN